MSANYLNHIKLVFFDFDGVFTDNRVFVDQNGNESVICNRSDGLGLKLLNDLGIKYYVISTETNPIVAHRCQKLKAEYVQGVENKADVVLSLMDKNNVEPSSCLFLGNDINDIPAFQVVGVAVAVNDRNTDIDMYVNLILDREGGNGAVYELCRRISESQSNAISV